MARIIIWLLFSSLLLFVTEIQQCVCAVQREEYGAEGKYLMRMIVPGLDAERMRRKRSSRIVERPGNSVESHDCGSVSRVPIELRRPEMMYPRGLDAFYQKYTHAYGIPIVASNVVSDTAIKRACYMMQFLLADRPDVRESFYKMFGRYALMAPTEMTTDIPEYSDMDPDWDRRARGLGATRHNPVSSGSEENSLCLKDDRYPHEDVNLHELIHGVHLLGATYAIPDFEDRLTSSYSSVKARGLWANTYAGSAKNEYWAEAVQSYFNDNDVSLEANGVHNHVHNRTELKKYDPDIYALIEEIWPCKNTFLPRCFTSRDLEAAQQLKMNCNGTNNNYFSYYAGCVDREFDCPHWAAIGECSRNQHYMRRHCRRSCRLCTTTYRGKANHGRKIEPTVSYTCLDVARNCDSTTCTHDTGRSATQCRKTCGSCQYYIDLRSNVCKDHNNYCPLWASIGECTSNPPYMLTTCKKSCDACL